MRSRVLVSLLSIAALWPAIAPVRTSAQSALENRLKAAIVSKLPQFVEWPAEATAGKASIDLCVLRDNPITDDLRALVAGQSVGGTPLAVRTIARDDDVAGCELLFVGSQELAAHRTLLTRAAAAPVLTVSDDASFLDQGGIIQLREVNNRFRFEINVAAARRTGLRISSQLLQLALAVRDGPS
jgi:hypothetical protein